MLKRFITWYMNKMLDFYLRHPWVFVLVMVSTFLNAFFKTQKVMKEQIANTAVSSFKLPEDVTTS